MFLCFECRLKNNVSYVSNMLDSLGWRSLENRRIDSRLVIFHRVIHGYVAIQIPVYFEKPQRNTRHMHHLCYRQIHTFAAYCQQSFTQLQLFSGIDFSFLIFILSDIVLRADIDAFKEGVCKINHQSPYTFNTVLI